MTRQQILLIFILVVFLASCEQSKTEAKNEPKQAGYTLDTSVVAVLPFDTTQYWFFKDGKPTDLTNEDLLKIETMLHKCIEAYNPDCEKRFNEINSKHPEYKLDKKSFVIDLIRYKRQYLAIINAKSEKEVLVNCFCSEPILNWRENLIVVKDGGNCYFNLKINLTTEQCYELMVNGEA